MSESEPKSTAQSEIDAYTQARKARDKEQLLESIFDGSVTGQNENDQKRVLEGTAYYEHLEGLSKREPGFDDYDTQLMAKAHEEALAENQQMDAEKQAKVDRIEAQLQSEPRLRRLQMMAEDIASQRNHVVVEGDDEAKLQSILQDKELKFQELFDQYEADGLDHETLEHILNNAFAHSVEAQTTPFAPEDVTGSDQAETETQPGNETDETTVSPETDPTPGDEGAEDQPAEESDSSVEREKTGEPLFQKGDKAIYQGENGPEEVTIETAFMAADLSNEVVYRITLEDGSVVMVGEDQLSAIEAPVEEDAGTVEPGTDQPETDPETEESEEKDTLRQKAVKGLKLLFGGANAWAAAWSTKKAIQRHIREEMTPEEIEAERKKNRIKYIAGGVVITAAAIAAAVLVAKGLDDGQAQEAVKELAKQGAEGQAGLDWQIPNEFPINPGDGMTQGIQNALESVGRDLTPDQYLDLHNTITNEYGPNYIINQGSPTNRMEVDPNSSFAPGVNEVIMRWMAANNIR